MILNVQEFVDSLACKDLAKYAMHFAEDIELYTPIQEEAVVSKMNAGQILEVIYSCFGECLFSDIVSGPDSHALIFQADVNGINFQGVNYITTNDRGQIIQFNLMIRPLVAITALSRQVWGRVQASQAAPHWRHNRSWMF